MKEIKPAFGKMVISVEMEKKNSHTFEDGTKIRLERQFDNFDQKYTQPVNATVIASEYIPVGAEVIIHHNATHDSYRLFNYEPLSGVEVAKGVKYFSIDEGFAYLYRLPESEEWLPCRGFATGLRIFKPYEGAIEGIEPTKIDKKLYITSGEFKGKVCIILHASDYEMIFQGTNGREQRVIRCRHFEGDTLHEREEIIAIDNDATKKVKSGKYHIGLNKKDCQPLK